MSHWTIFLSYVDISIFGEGLRILTYTRHLVPLSSDGSIAFFTYCNMHSLFPYPYISPRTRDTHSCGQAFGSGYVTTCFNDLGMSRLGIEPRSPACETNALPQSHLWKSVENFNHDLNLEIFKFFKSFHSWGQPFSGEISTRDSTVLFCSIAASIDQWPTFCSPPPVEVSDVPIRVKYSWTGRKLLIKLLIYIYPIERICGFWGSFSRHLVNVRMICCVFIFKKNPYS